MEVHASRLGEKMRRDGLGNVQITVYYHTREHDCGEPMCSVSTVVNVTKVLYRSRS
ncbi:hypothetical protein [Methylobacterium sp. E-016]|uniref:hypothetical protein n=1 Tax=Methylobacterium sp. E-016 TaxID=2836556 RepID=UPI00391D9340